MKPELSWQSFEK